VFEVLFVIAKLAMYQILVLWLCFMQLSFCMVSYQPEQIHLSFGGEVCGVFKLQNLEEVFN
jgi:hypothetical protein